MSLPADGAITPRDYLATGNGLYFAVVMPSSAKNTYICSLRYVCGGGGDVQKLDTGAACRFLKTRHSRFLEYCGDLGGEAVVVRRGDVDRIYKPVEARRRLEHTKTPDSLEAKAIQALAFLRGKGVEGRYLGITGSLMLGFHRTDSDIDIVVYDSDAFELARQAVREAIAAEELAGPGESMWREIHRRRGCSLSLHDYMKHERRKFNKFILDDTKVDISYVPPRARMPEFKRPVRKLGAATLKAVVKDASRSFDYPACYVIDNDTVRHVYCYTATYTGQALAGEVIEAAGMIEEDADGTQYMVIGTSREAPGEYLRVADL